ncbi:MAG: YceI family protein [Alkalispirochaeta sp.]
MRSRIGIVIIAIVAVILLGFAAFSAYIWFSGGAGEPTRETVTETVEPAEPRSVVYTVDNERSEARFLIDEVLRGEDKTVVGTTDQVAGSIAIGFEPPDVEIGEFEINLRAISTDDEMRDRSIRTLILETNKDEFEFSSFRPTTISGVPDSINVGDTLDLVVTGELTVRDVTITTDFEMTIEIGSQREIRATAATVVEWEELEITIPYVGDDSSVQAVDDEVRLEMEVVATAR